MKKVILTIAIALISFNLMGGTINTYPNPTNGIVTIELQGVTATSIYLASADGKVVNSYEAVTVLKIDLSDLPVGIYYLVVLTTDGKDVKRIVKY